MFFSSPGESTLDKVELQRIVQSVVRILWSDGGLSRSAAFDEVCKLLWMQVLLRQHVASDIAKNTSSIRGYYSFITKEYPVDAFAEPLGTDNSMAYAVLKELDRLDWLNLKLDDRVFFLKYLSIYTKRSYIGYHTLSSGIIHGLMELLDAVEARKILYATSDDDMLAVELLNRRRKSESEQGCCSLCVPNRSFGRLLEQMMLLVGVATKDERLTSSIEDPRLDEIAFDFAFINTILLDQPISVVGGHDYRRRFDLTERYFERMFTLLREGAYVGALISRTLSGNDRWQYVRDSIERKFRLRAVIDIRMKCHLPIGNPLLMLFRRRVQELPAGYHEKCDIYLNRMDWAKECGAEEADVDSNHHVPIFHGLLSFLREEALSISK